MANHKLSLTNILTLRRCASNTDKALLLREWGVPEREWATYLNAPSSLSTHQPTITVVTTDPLKHFEWAILWLSGASLTQLAKFFGVHFTSVGEGMRKIIPLSQRQKVEPRISMERLELLDTVWNQNREVFIEMRHNPLHATAMHLIRLADERD